jgi:hypothetical protein
MKKCLPAIMLAYFALYANLNAAAPVNSLDLFLHSCDLPERRAAYLDILNYRGQYVDQIKQGLETLASTKEERIGVLNRLIYLAAIIRSDNFIQPLVSIFRNYYELGGSCNVCCPIVFALTLYGAFENWSLPHELIANVSTSGMAYDVRDGVYKLEGMRSKPFTIEPLSWEPFADPEVQKWFESIQEFSVDELIRIAGPANLNANERHIASEVLAGKVIDDKNLTELYWLAIEELPRDPSGRYLCCTYEAIERAEIARAQKREK